MYLPPLYPIVNLPDLTDPMDYIAKLFSCGISIIQLRDKVSETRLESVAHQTVRFLESLKNQDGLERMVIINDSVQICLNTGAHGLHIGQGDIEPTQARSLIGPHKYLGLSAHALEHASLHSEIIDYFGFGPIFPTTTKSCCIEETGLPLLAKFCAITTKPVVAIGGITSQRARSVFEHGANSLAVISALANASNLETEIARFNDSHLCPRASQTAKVVPPA